MTFTVFSNLISQTVTLYLRANTKSLLVLWSLTYLWRSLSLRHYILLVRNKNCWWYVDDTVVIWQQAREQLVLLLDHLNGLIYKIYNRDRTERQVTFPRCPGIETR